MGMFPSLGVTLEDGVDFVDVVKRMAGLRFYDLTDAGQLFSLARPVDPDAP